MAALSQVTAARATVRVLRGLGRLEPVDDALVTAFLGLAEAVDAGPDNAAPSGLLTNEMDLGVNGGNRIEEAKRRFDGPPGPPGPNPETPAEIVDPPRQGCCADP